MLENWYYIARLLFTKSNLEKNCLHSQKISRIQLLLLISSSNILAQRVSLLPEISCFSPLLSIVYSHRAAKVILLKYKDKPLLTIFELLNISLREKPKFSHDLQGIIQSAIPSAPLPSTHPHSHTRYLPLIHYLPPLVPA